MIDAYSITFGIALLCTLAVAFGMGGCARAKGSLLLVASWLGVMALQRATGEYSAPLIMAVMDFALFIAFGLIALLYNRKWAWLVSGLHVAMLLSHAGYVMTGEMATYAYLTILAGLGYASMLVIAVPPVAWKIVGRAHEAVDYSDFMRGSRLPPSAFQSGKGKET